MKRKKYITGAFVAAALGLLTACGGGGGDAATPSATGGGTIRGFVIKGPAAGTTVTAYGMNADGTAGGTLGFAVTGTRGQFAIQTGEYSGPVYLEAKGGRYTDEATGTGMAILPGSPLTCVIPYKGPDSDIGGVQITPLTTIAERMAEYMEGGLTRENASAANRAVGRYFMVEDILHTMPMDTLAVNSGDAATTGERDYGMSVAAMSMYSHSKGILNSTDMVWFMSQDAADGHMDGYMWNGPIEMGNGMHGPGGMMGGGWMMPTDAGTAGLAQAMEEFILSEHNRSGVTVEEMQRLMDNLRYSSGALK